MSPQNLPLETKARKLMAILIQKRGHPHSVALHPTS